MKNDAQYLPEKSRIPQRIFLLLMAVLLLTLLNNKLFSQSTKETISVSELISRMQVDSEKIEISNVTIEFRNEDKKLAKSKIFSWVFIIKPTTAGPKKVYFYDCDFNNGKKAPLVFEGWDFKKMNMTGCALYSNISFKDCKQSGQDPLLFENNTFHENLQFEGKDSPSFIQFSNCRFNKQLLVETMSGAFEMDKCIFDADTLIFEGAIEENTLFQLSFNGQKAVKINISNSTFLNNGLKNVYSVDFGGVVVDKITLLNNQMVALNFTDIQVEKAILIDSLAVSDYIGVQNFDFPETNTNIPWYNLGGEKLAIFQFSEFGQIIPYQAKTKEQLLNTLLYNDLISAYNKLNAIYRSRGDIFSANKSYVEMKTIETRRQKYLLEEKWNKNVYINYKLNEFLSSFSDFATNPGKALIWSIVVLLMFTVLYMLTYSEGDGMNYNYFIDQYSRFSKYIKKEKDIEDIYGKDYEKQIKDIESIEEKYINAGKKVPWIIRLAGAPLYHLGKFRYRIVPSLIRIFNFQPEKWEKLQGTRRLITYPLIFIISILFIIYVVFVKFINAFAISLNSFGMIVYGILPDKGLAKYFSIIEGIIGWFLLMIFTITLLSQVLQSAG